LRPSRGSAGRCPGWQTGRGHREEGRATALVGLHVGIY
jgi:hypothetical protein